MRLGADAERHLPATVLRDADERDPDGVVDRVADLRLRELRLDLLDRRADPHPARLRPALDLDVGDLARRLRREVHRAEQRLLQPGRAGVRAAELAARGDLLDEPSRA